MTDLMLRAVGIGKTPWQLLLGTLNSAVVCCGLLLTRYSWSSR